MNAELEGAELDAAVARLEGEPVEVRDGKAVHPGGLWPYEYDYTTSWASGGPLIQRRLINVEWLGSEWCAKTQEAGKPFAEDSAVYPIRTTCLKYGPTPLIAACRAYVGSKTPNARLTGPKRPPQEYANGTD